MYHVWRRSDGYVGCTAGRVPLDVPGYTFDRLLSTDDWQKARKRLAHERDDQRHVALVASWDREQ